VHRLNQSEFAAMFTANARSLWCVAAAMLADRALAEDAVQEAALIALRKLETFEPGTSFSAWMGRIVRNVSRNLARRRAQGPLPASGTPTLEGACARHEMNEDANTVMRSGTLRTDQDSFDDQVTAALSTLSETARSCLLLRTVLDLPYREIAALLSIPEGTAMSHVHRARQQMREQLTTKPPAHAPEESLG
jgi:RNA polymerase sigma-70 factor (ECF subfamily)